MLALILPPLLLFLSAVTLLVAATLPLLAAALPLLALAFPFAAMFVSHDDLQKSSMIFDAREPAAREKWQAPCRSRPGAAPTRHPGGERGWLPNRRGSSSGGTGSFLHAAR
jgi:hypothetical protein